MAGTMADGNAPMRQVLAYLNGNNTAAYGGFNGSTPFIKGAMNSTANGLVIGYFTVRTGISSQPRGHV